MDSLGDEAEAAGRDARAQLERDERDRRKHGDERSTALRVHARRLLPDELEVAAERLLALDRLEERLEVPLAEAARPMPLDHLEEERRPVLERAREDLQEVALVV